MHWPFSLPSSSNQKYWLLTWFTQERKPFFRDTSLGRALMYLFIDLSFDTKEELLAWSVLPEHIHLLLRCDHPQYYVAYFRNEAALFLPDGSFGESKQKLLVTEREFIKTFLLIHEEPQWQGYAEDPLDYPFSSYHDYLRRFGLPFDTFVRTHRPTLRPRSWRSSCVFSSRGLPPASS